MVHPLTSLRGRASCRSEILIETLPSLSTHYQPQPPGPTQIQQAITELTTVHKHKDCVSLKYIQQ